MFHSAFSSASFYSFVCHKFIIDSSSALSHRSEYSLIVPLYCRFLFREYFSRVFLYVLRLERQFDRQLVMQQRTAALKCAPRAGDVGRGKTPAASQSRLVSFLSNARSLLSGGRRQKVQSESLARMPAASAAQCSAAASRVAAAELSSSSSCSARRACSSSELQQPDAARKISNTASTASSSNARSSTSTSTSASASAQHSRTSTASSSCADPLAPEPAFEPEPEPAKSESDLSARERDAQEAVALDSATQLHSTAAGSAGETACSSLAASTVGAERELLCCEPSAPTPSAALPPACELAAQCSPTTASNSLAERSLTEILPVLADDKYEKKLRQALRLNTAQDLRLIRVCLILCTHPLSSTTLIKYEYTRSYEPFYLLPQAIGERLFHELLKTSSKAN